MSKRLKFILGEYICEVPPVCTDSWHAEDWCVWIDENGFWA